VLIAAGCAGNQKVSPPDWIIAEREKKEIADGHQLPILCEVPWTDSECWGFFEQYEIISEGNVVIADANARAARATNAALDDVVRAGRMQQEYAELREEMLAEERRQHTYDNWFYRGLLSIGGIAVILKD